MADTYTGKKITALTEKTSGDDTDLLVLGDQGTATMKKLRFSNLATYIRDKLKSLTFSELNTAAKTLPDAINEMDGMLFYRPGDTAEITGRFSGFVTGGSASIQIDVPLLKSAARVNGVTVVNVVGGFRISTGGYADNVVDGTSWTGRTGISYTVYAYNNHSVTVGVNKTSAYKQNGTTTNVVNNAPITLGGGVTLRFS